MEAYNFTDIEQRWKRHWKENKAFRLRPVQARATSTTHWSCSPIPQATFSHAGHGRNYIIGDAVYRYFKAKGHNVLNPMGFDAFGLPAENAAIHKGVHPESGPWAISSA